VTEMSDVAWGTNGLAINSLCARCGPNGLSYR
jgi:hypothetical protein